MANVNTLSGLPSLQKQVAVLAGSVALGVMSGFAFGFLTDLSLKMFLLYYLASLVLLQFWFHMYSDLNMFSDTYIHTTCFIVLTSLLLFHIGYSLRPE